MQNRFGIPDIMQTAQNLLPPPPHKKKEIACIDKVKIYDAFAYTT